MSAGTRAIKAAIAVAAVFSSLLVPAYAQQSLKKSHVPPSTETRQPVDEKAYKAALDRIPEPKKPYDPWGVARPSEPEKTGK